MMFASRIGSSTSCSIWLLEHLPPTSARGLSRHRFQSCNTSLLSGRQAHPAEGRRTPAQAAERASQQARRRVYSELAGREEEVPVAERYHRVWSANDLHGQQRRAASVGGD